MRLYTLFFAAVFILSSQLAFAVAPSAPGDLRAAVYSSTAAEIFWSRSSDPDSLAIGYEIRQDGSPITTIDGLSFFTENLTDGVATIFSVTAIDSDGERSDEVSISVTGGERNNSGGGLAPPANLSTLVYSNTAAEVFWDRNNEQTLTYDVFVDGDLVTTTDGTSYFSDGFEVGQSINIEVVAINVNGQRSDATSVQFTTTGNAPEVNMISAPSNLRLEVYSVTAVELFWDRSSQSDLISTTEIRRDGDLISTTNGTSFFDDTRESGVEYRYEVMFIGVNGEQSAASSVGTNSHGGDDLEPVQVSLQLVQDKTFRISWQQSEGAQFYRVLENPDGVSGFTGISEDLNATTTDFDHRVALYARVNAQYLVQSCNDQGCVDSEPVIVTGTLASAIGYFKASNTDENDQFGGSVSLSADGNTLAVGASLEDSLATGVNGDQNDNSVPRAGAVYVFARSGEIWQQEAYLKASNSNENDGFGGSVSLSADGNTLAVGALGEASGATGINGDDDDNSADRSGAVFVFVRNAETWQQQAYVKASNSEQSDRFGWSVSLSADGSTLAVGATSEDSAATGINGDQNEGVLITSGAVYVFVRNGETWQQQAYVKASNTGEFDLFGFSVSLSADGNTLAVGAVSEESRATGINGEQRNNTTSLAGAVYVFVRNAETWQQQAYLKASNTKEFDFFGFSVSLSEDGNTLAVGAHNEDSAAIGVNGDQSDNPPAGLSGAVYLFARSGETWQQEAYIKASNTDSEDEFGFSVSLSADGNTLAVGADGEDSAATGITGDEDDNSVDGSGAVYVFARNGAIWQQQAYIKASNTDSGDVFGRSVSLSADGNTLAVGSLGEDSAAIGINGDQDDNSVSRSGAVYLY